MAVYPPSTNPKIIIKSYLFHMEAFWQLRGSALLRETFYIFLYRMFQ